MAPPGLGNDHRIVEERLLAKSAANGVTIHARHPDIEQDCVGTVVLRRLHGELTFMDHPVVVTDRLEHPAHGLRDIDIVVHNQDLQR